MSDYEDNVRKSDYEMGSGWNDDEDIDDDGDEEGDNSDHDNESNDDNINSEDEGISGTRGYGDNDADDLELPSKRVRFDSMAQYTSDYQTSNDTSSAEGKKPAGYDVPNESIGSRILGKMGHKPGTGLGKHGQGRVEPVAASDQIGTRGFGYHPDESKLNVKVDPELEGISLKEDKEWLENSHPRSDIITRDVLKRWLRKGPEKLSYDNEYHFCKQEALQSVLDAKNNLNDVDDLKIKKSRSRLNPFETIKGGIFQNRAAMKMANIEHVFDNMFTNPKDQDGKEIIGPNDLLYFADVCAGPGGFSEYVFFRKKWRAKGFGFTLREKNDFKLEDFFAGSCETFEPHYGVPIDNDLGDGNIFKPENIREFCSFVMKNTEGKGVHFMMADGGFSVEEKSYQEIVSKQLYLCQCLVALKIVRENGNFIVKLFDIFTPFSVGLVYLMYRSFDRISIHKPNTSRPANSERYLICQYKRSNCSDIADHLRNVNELLCERHMKKEDVLELVSLDVLKDDKDFYNYIEASNNRLCKRQAFHLQNLLYYCEFPEHTDSRQEEFKGECLKLWQVPNEARTDPYKGDVTSVLKTLFPNNADMRFLNEEPLEINKDSFENIWKKFKVWYWTIVESDRTSKSLTFYLGLGRTNVYKYIGGSWIKFQDLPSFQLPAGTLVYGETVRENICNPKNQKMLYHVPAFHIVDGLFLGYEKIGNEFILQRNKCCEMFAKALSRSNMIYRVKELEMMNEDPYRDLSISLSKYVRPRSLKNRKVVLGYDLEENRFIVPGGLLFFPETKDNWGMNLSTKQNRLYYFDTSTNSSTWKSDMFEPDGRIKQGLDKSEYYKIFSDFQTCVMKRRVWWLNENDLKELALRNIEDDCLGMNVKE